MSLDEAEMFAAEAAKFDADLDYLEAATKDSGASAQASTQGPVVEDSPHVLEEVKNIKKKKATRKMKAKGKSAGLAAAVAAAAQEGRFAREQEQPEPEAKAEGQDKAEPEVTDVVCPFASLSIFPIIIHSIPACLPNFDAYYAWSSMQTCQTKKQLRRSSFQTSKRACLSRLIRDPQVALGFIVLE